MTDTTGVTLTDAAMMRVMAHPLRMRIVGSLRLDGPATSAILARRLTTDSGQTSHHLRLLAKHGFVIEAPEKGRGTHGRERWWKAAHRSTYFGPMGAADDEAARAVDRTAREVWNYAIDLFLDEAAHGKWSPSWRQAATSNEHIIRTTPAGLERLNAQIDELISAADEPGGETVMIVVHGYPRRVKR